MVVLSEQLASQRLDDLRVEGHRTPSFNSTGTMASSSDAVVYILKCADGSFYVGKTALLRTRLDEHESGVGADYTKVRRPVEMVYAEEHSTIRGAKNRELQLKRWSRAKKEALIAQDLARLKRA
jgi:putative endonuclease